MSVTQIFVNLPVADVAKATAFYTALGFQVNPQFSDDKTTGLVLGENIFAMLMTHERFNDFNSVGVATDGIEVINALGVTSREGVDQVTDAALVAGGAEPRPAQDMGWMYNRAFIDLDGHHWEAVYVDEVAMAEAFADAG